MDTLRLLASLALGYLVGSISSAVIVSKVVSNKDVRNYGSGNAGATNMARLFGMGLGVATLFLDFLKTCAAMALGRLVGGYHGLLVAGFACMLGHCFPLFFGFKGGKGVSVGAAMGLMLDWRLFLLIVAVFFVTFALTQRVSAGSIMCALTFAPFEYMLGMRDWPSMLFGILSGLCVFFMHRENLKRLLRGEEKKFTPKKTK